MRLAIVGSGQLAQATRENCEKVGFELVSPPQADLVWLCHDMPLNERDEDDVDAILSAYSVHLPYIRPGTPIMVSTQVRVGFCQQLEELWPQHEFIIQPENIRKASNVSDFANQERMVVGSRHLAKHQQVIESVLLHFTSRIIYMSPEEAEMTKLVLNTFLAMEIAFANEVAQVCEMLGVETAKVFQGFRSDHRVGDAGPLSPGGPYGGGSLARDVLRLINSGGGCLIKAIKASNDARIWLSQS